MNEKSQTKIKQWLILIMKKWKPLKQNYRSIKFKSCNNLFNHKCKQLLIYIFFLLFFKRFWGDCTSSPACMLMYHTADQHCSDSILCLVWTVKQLVSFSIDRKCINSDQSCHRFNLLAPILTDCLQTFAAVLLQTIGHIQQFPSWSQAHFWQAIY